MNLSLIKKIKVNAVSKAVSKRAVIETTGNLIGGKIPNQIIGKSKNLKNVSNIPEEPKIFPKRL